MTSREISVTDRLAGYRPPLKGTPVPDGAVGRYSEARLNLLLGLSKIMAEIRIEQARQPTLLSIIREIETTPQNPA